MKEDKARDEMKDVQGEKSWGEVEVREKTVKGVLGNYRLVLVSKECVWGLVEDTDLS